MGVVSGISDSRPADASSAGSLRAGSVHAFVEAFGGTHRFVLDYLMEEVLGQQPPAVQRFLIETSILERMCGPLCDAVRFGAQSETGPRK